LSTPEAPAEPRPSDHLVHDAVGPPLTGVEAGAAIALGVVSLLIAGEISILLGGLADLHRISAQDIGLAAAVEALTMGVVTSLAGVFLKPRRLRWLGIGASVALALVDLSVTRVSGDAILAVRALAGVPEGLLLWITIGMIARTETPERWSGVLFTALTAAQLGVAAIFTAGFLPRFGPDGGFVFLSVVSLAGVGISLFAPDRYAPLPHEAGSQSGAPPLRGWIALLATFLYVAATGAVAIYLVPLAHQAGLTAMVAQTAVSASLAAQIPGSALATLVAGRVRYFAIFVFATLVAIVVFATYGFTAPAWLFIGATTVQGFVGIFVTPFLLPMTIEADPSRRAAVQSGAAQLLGGAFGPLVASMAVDDHHARGVLPLGGAMLLAGMAIIAALRFTSRAATPS
jgi:MFS family permease